MKRYRIKMKFKNPVHIGYREGMYNLTETIIHSDTIFSALVNCYNLLFGLKNTEQFLAEVLEGRLLVSSAFYYVDDEYFLPRPMDMRRYAGDFKEDKKIKYISQKIFKGEIGKGFRNGDMFGEKDKIKSVYKVEERPRVVVDRLTNATNIYYTSACRFNEGCGLWFYLDVTEELEKEVWAALNLLQDEGLGGERTYGYGNFNFEREEVFREKPGPKNLLLSLCLPASNEEIKKFTSYGLVQRTGYVFSPYHMLQKHSVFRMFAEGSIVEGQVEGSIYDDTPEGFTCHKVFKYGKAFLLPLE